MSHMTHLYTFIVLYFVILELDSLSPHSLSLYWEPCDYILQNTFCFSQKRWFIQV